MTGSGLESAGGKAYCGEHVLGLELTWKLLPEPRVFIGTERNQSEPVCLKNTLSARNLEHPNVLRSCAKQTRRSLWWGPCQACAAGRTSGGLGRNRLFRKLSRSKLLPERVRLSPQDVRCVTFIRHCFLILQGRFSKPSLQRPCRLGTGCVTGTLVGGARELCGGLAGPRGWGLRGGGGWGGGSPPLFSRVISPRFMSGLADVQDRSRTSIQQCYDGVAHAAPGAAFLSPGSPFWSALLMSLASGLSTVLAVKEEKEPKSF